MVVCCISSSLFLRTSIRLRIRWESVSGIPFMYERIFRLCILWESVFEVLHLYINTASPYSVGICIRNSPLVRILSGCVSKILHFYTEILRLRILWESVSEAFRLRILWGSVSKVLHLYTQILRLYILWESVSESSIYTDKHCVSLFCGSLYLNPPFVHTNIVSPNPVGVCI